MDRAVSLSTDASAESSVHRVSTRTNPTWVSESRVGQSADESWSADRAPQRHVEAYQQVPDPQPPHRQDADAYWADKIAEVMRD